MRPHLIQKSEPDEAIGPGGRLVYEEAHLIATKFIQTVLEGVNTGSIDSLLWQTVPPIMTLAEEMTSYVQMAMMFNHFHWMSFSVVNRTQCEEAIKWNRW